MLTILLNTYPLAANGTHVARFATWCGRRAQANQAGMSRSVTLAERCVR
jgi:hypothetical protein